LSYSNESFGDGGTRARVRIVSAKLISGDAHTTVKTLSGKEISIGGDEAPPESNIEENSAPSDSGETVEKILFSEMDEELLEDVRVLVVKDDEVSFFGEEENIKQKSKISAFSNVDYLLGKYNLSDKKKSEEEADSQKADTETSKSDTPPGAMPAKVDVVWEVNGRCEPHKVWVYLDGMSHEDGVCIRVDRFGAVKVLSEDDKK
jgi:hypothetical protein